MGLHVVTDAIVVTDGAVVTDVTMETGRTVVTDVTVVTNGTVVTYVIRWPRGALDAISDLRRDFQTLDAILLWPRGALDAISDLQRDFQTSDFGRDFTVAERGIGRDFRSPTRFSDFGLRTRFYCGREGHWTRFQISDAISDFRRDLQTLDFGRDCQTSDF